MVSSRSGVAKLAIISIIILIVIKAIAAILTGSISIRADAIHSVIDLSGVIVGYIGIRISDKPPDEKHTFGHGKAESIASAIIAGLIFVAAGTIFYEAIRRLISGGTLALVDVGIYITLAAIVINGAMSWYSLRVAHTTDSLALEASARDMLADVLSSVAVLVGLILVRFTGLVILDPIVALLVAVLIARTAFMTMKKSLSDLIDTKLPEEEERIITLAITEHIGELTSFHALRTRKAGNQRYIELHIVMRKNAVLEEAHRLCDHLEEDIKNKLPHTSVIIHTEPCSGECETCPVPLDQCPDKYQDKW